MQWKRIDCTVCNSFTKCLRYKYTHSIGSFLQNDSSPMKAVFMSGSIDQSHTQKGQIKVALGEKVPYVDAFRKAKSDKGSLSLTSVQKYLERGTLYTCIGLAEKDSNTKSSHLFSTSVPALTWLKGSIGRGNEFTKVSPSVSPSLWPADTCSPKCRHILSGGPASLKMLCWQVT